MHLVWIHIYESYLNELDFQGFCQIVLEQLYL